MPTSTRIIQYGVGSIGGALCRGAIGHVGLEESLEFLAYYRGWELDFVETTIKPVTTSAPMHALGMDAQSPQTIGQHQRIVGLCREQPLITMELSMYLGAQNPRGEISIDGDPPIHMVIQSGVHGDASTVGVMLNSINPVLKASPGLLTVADLPVAIP